MAALFEGDFHGRAIKAEYGTKKNGTPQCRVVLEITSKGEGKGCHVQWAGNFKSESIKYTKRDMVALGWQGKTVGTFVDDVMADPKEVPFQVRIAEWTDPATGKLKRWLSAGSIGYEPMPLNAPTSDTTRSVDSWFAEAGDVRPAGTGGPDDDLPF
jgi:hypothetical protein